MSGFGPEKRHRVTFEVRGPDHAQRVIDAVRGAGYPDLQAALGR